MDSNSIQGGPSQGATEVGTFSGLRARLLWLVLLAVLPALGLILYTAHQSGRLAARQTVDEAQLLVRLAAADYARLVANSRELLGTLALLPEVRGRDAAGCHTLMARIKSGYGQYLNLGVIGPDGWVFCSAVPTAQRVNVTDRAYFKRALETRDFAIGDFQIGRITGRPVVVFSYPDYEANGRLRAVVFAALDLAWLDQLAAKAQLPDGSRVTLFDGRGVILHRYPESEGWIGKSPEDSPLMRAILASRSEGTIETAGLDHVPRLYAFAPLLAGVAGGGAYLSVGIPRDIAFADVNRIFVHTFAGLALVALLVLAAAWYGGDVFLLRKIRALVSASRRLAQGDLSARSGLAHGRDELGELARAFDETATALGIRGAELGHAMEALRDNEERFRSLVETTSDWIWEVDARGMYTYSSPKVVELLGYTPEEIVGKSPFDFMPPDEAARVGRQFTEFARARRPFERLENVNLRKDGGRVVLETSGVPIFDRDGRLAGYRGIDRDITERVRAQAKLKHLAYHDELTDLPNRALLLDRLRQGLLETARQDRGVAAVCLDLRDFKTVNDTLGHETGNRLLQAVAERLQTCVRPGDTVARLGGDKFGMMLADVSHHEDVTRVLQKIRAEFAQPLRVDDRELHLSMTFGISLYPSDGADAETLLKNADIAMYRARERDDDHQYYSADMTASAAERLALENDLRRALERHELLLHYQPQVSLASGAITGVEALLRWRHPQHGMISPAKFIPLAEQTGLILPIGEWVLREACAQARTWQAAGWPLRVAVNLSARQFRQPGLDELIRGVLEETGLDPDRLDIELTESTIVHDPTGVAAIFAGLERLGVQVSIDDFGTGYSSLSYLKRFSIDVLKIDQVFVRDIAVDPDDAAIVRAIITMAHALGIQTIAEGVETREQLAFLRKNRCDAMQGYYFSRPASADDISRLLEDGKRLTVTERLADEPT
ncbi:MAG: EAL domain-containing protein [Gammaproteobacteria bacterium]|nr:EAL domain-containing protein [Gammaproteobacteria bacterium]